MSRRVGSIESSKSTIINSITTDSLSNTYNAREEVWAATYDIKINSFTAPGSLFGIVFGW